jgi:hydrogenase expression/formation protein HypC
MRVVQVDGLTARCEAWGQERVLDLFLLQHESVQCGDYVLAHLGRALRKVPADEARASQGLLQDMLQAASPEGGAT